MLVDRLNVPQARLAPMPAHYGRLIKQSNFDLKDTELGLDNFCNVRVAFRRE
jgi:hypothetical protein